jgi:hypothetical protein
MNLVPGIIHSRPAFPPLSENQQEWESYPKTNGRLCYFKEASQNRFLGMQTVMRLGENR